MSEIFEKSYGSLPKPNYIYVTKKEDVLAALNEISNCPVIEFDTETTGLDPFTSKIVLAQIGIPDKSFVFDVRGDTPHSDFFIDELRPVLENPNIVKIIQNAVFDMKIVKSKAGFYPKNVFDTMLVEQLINLGKLGVKAGLKSLVQKYLYLDMPKDPAETFQDYGQTFQKFQLEYAANDVSVLSLIKDLQWSTILSEGLAEAALLEFDFTVPMCEMELNGITLDIFRQRAMMEDLESERDKKHKFLSDEISRKVTQKTLFGAPIVNIDSNSQLKKVLGKFGINLPSTSVGDLAKYSGHPIVDALLEYRKSQKLVTTYGETLIEKIHPLTGRIHTEFKQMVSTGRMSSSNPNLQNIPNAQMYRTAFVASDGYSLITCDMSGAELRILANLSQDEIFVHSYRNGIDLHTRAAAEVFGVPYDKVSKSQRKAAKAIQFGLCVEENSVLFTDAGLKSIKDVEINDSAVHDLGTNLIIDKSYMGEKEVFEIKTEFGYTLEVTEDHPIKVIDSEGLYTDKCLKDIDLSKDYACLKSSSNIFVPDNFKFKEFKVTRNTNFKDFNLPVFLSEDWAAFFGLFASEGSVLRVKGRENYSVLSFRFSNKIKEFISKIDMLMNNLFGNRLCRLENEEIVQYTINSVLLAEWVVSVFNLHSVDKTDDIRVPSCIKMSPFNVQRAFVSWLFEGDGTVKKNGNGFKISYSSKSFNLVKDLQILFLNVGILTSITVESRKKYPGEKYYELSVISDESRSLFLNSIRFVTDYKNDKCVKFCGETESTYFLPNQNERLKKILENRSNDDLKNRKFYDVIYNALNYTKGLGNKYFSMMSKNDEFIKFIYDNNIITLPIVSVESKGIKRVYDISVDKHQYFLANGFIVHNCYGLSEFGLARRLGINKKEAQDMINAYFNKYRGIKTFLDKVSSEAVSNGFSRSIVGRKRYYNIPEWSNPDRERIVAGIKRQAKNAPIQSSNADTIKQAMIYCVERLKGYDARLVLTVHDEVVVEAKNEIRHEVAEIVRGSLIDGFGKYFSIIPMETEALIGPCWLKGDCDKGKGGCGSPEMMFVKDEKYGNKLVCAKCGKEQ